MAESAKKEGEKGHIRTRGNLPQEKTGQEKKISSRGAKIRGKLPSRKPFESTKLRVSDKGKKGRKGSLLEGSTLYGQVW